MSQEKELLREHDASPGLPGWIFFEEREGGPWVLLRGEIDFAVVGQVSDLAIQIKHRPGRPFTVDMAAVTFLDSVAIALLMRLYNLELRLRLVGVPGRVRRMFDVMGLSAVFGLETDPVQRVLA